jgi:hypothetical protein
MTALYRCSWVVQNICTTIPQDALKSFDITADVAPDLLAKMKRVIEAFTLRERLIDGFTWGRLYGGALGIICIDGHDDFMDMPLRLDEIERDGFAGLIIADRWSGIAPSLQLVDNTADPDFGLPEYYDFIAYGQESIASRVHHSRVIRFIGKQLPKIETAAEGYWGESEIEAAFEDIRKRDAISANIAELTFKSRVNVYAVEDLYEKLATGSVEQQQAVYNTVQAQSVLESTTGCRLIGKNDNVSTINYSYAGLPEIMNTAMLDVAGASRMPVTKLFGRQPSGLNATGEADAQQYRDTLDEFRRARVAPLLNRLVPIIAMSVCGELPQNLNYALPSLFPMNPEQQSIALDRRSMFLERLFVHNLVPADAVLSDIKDMAATMGVTIPITDEMVDNVRGKYYNDMGQAKAVTGSFS